MIPVGDEDALVDAMESVLRMSGSQRAAMAKAAREKILRHCSKENSVNVLCSLLK